MPYAELCEVIRKERTCIECVNPAIRPILQQLMISIGVGNLCMVIEKAYPQRTKTPQ